MCWHIFLWHLKGNVFHSYLSLVRRRINAPKSCAPREDSEFLVLRLHLCNLFVMVRGKSSRSMSWALGGMSNTWTGPIYLSRFGWSGWSGESDADQLPPDHGNLLAACGDINLSQDRSRLNLALHEDKFYRNLQPLHCHLGSVWHR